MVRFINGVTGVDMWVHESRVEEYIRLGHKPAGTTPEESPEGTAATAAPGDTEKPQEAPDAQKGGETPQEAPDAQEGGEKPQEPPDTQDAPETPKGRGKAKK